MCFLRIKADRLSFAEVANVCRLSEWWLEMLLQTSVQRLRLQPGLVHLHLLQFLWTLCGKVASCCSGTVVNCCGLGDCCQVCLTKHQQVCVFVDQHFCCCFSISISSVHSFVVEAHPSRLWLARVCGNLRFGWRPRWTLLKRRPKSAALQRVTWQVATPTHGQTAVNQTPETSLLAHLQLL